MLIHVTIIDHSECHARIIYDFTFDDEAEDAQNNFWKIQGFIQDGKSASMIREAVYSTLAYYPSGFVKGESKEMASPTWAGRNAVGNNTNPVT